MKIEAKELSKIYGVGENRVVALDKVNLEIAITILYPLWGHQEVAKAPCSISYPG